jgi:hypothetical protein
LIDDWSPVDEDAADESCGTQAARQQIIQRKASIINVPASFLSAR